MKDYFVQSSVFIRLIRRNAAPLVTKSASSASAWAAIIKSRFEIGIPERSSAARKSA